MQTKFWELMQVIDVATLPYWELVMVDYENVSMVWYLIHTPKIDAFLICTHFKKKLYEYDYNTWLTSVSPIHPKPFVIMADAGEWGVAQFVGNPASLLGCLSIDH